MRMCAPRAVLAIFNRAESGKKGIRELRAKGHLGEGATAVANFFLHNDGKLELEAPAPPEGKAYVTLARLRESLRLPFLSEPSWQGRLGE